MAWLFGLIAGVVVGAFGWGFSGAVVLGFIGWLAGIIAGSRKSSTPVVATTRPIESVDARMDRLERSIAAIEARLARLDDKGLPSPSGEGLGERVTPPQPIQVEEAQVPIVSAEPVAAVPRDDTAPRHEIAPPSEPPKPNFLVAWFTGGNAIVRIGALILFVGLIFLLNYAREHQMIAPEFRVAGVAILGIVLLVIGWRLRESRTGYAVSLQGAGIAILYLTIFAAMRLYNLISHEAAFFLLAAMAAFSAIVAIGQNSLALAVMGAGGGFLAPILASTGSGNHVVLFGYYLVLNLGIVAVAWFKAWRVLNLVGFAFTFLIALAWGERAYRPELFDTTEPFLVAFFFLYIAIAILSKPGSDPGKASLTSSRRYVDGTIVFGSPLAAFGLQAGLMKPFEFGLAYSSLAAASVYVVLATILHRQQSDRFRLLAESFLALGVVFASLAIPLALDARWTSAAWALEGAAIVWAGVRQSRGLARAFGMLLQIGAAIAFAYGFQRMPSGPPLVDAPFIGALLIAFAGLVTYRVLANAGERVTRAEVDLHPAAFVWGLVWWLFAGHYEMHEHLPGDTLFNAHVAFFAATALVSIYLLRARGWSHARWPVITLLPALWIMGFVEFLSQPHPFAAYGWLAWPFALAVQVYTLRALDKLESPAAGALHAGTLLLASALGAWQMHWCAVQVTATGTAWSVASVLLVPAALLLLAASKELDGRWPLDRHERAYRVNAALVLLVAMCVWILYANATHDGNSAPLPYFPIVNAIDLGHGLVAICFAGTILAWRRRNLYQGAPFGGRPLWVVVGILSFIWLNGVLLRSLHHWADIPYTEHAMTHSLLVQASISIFWSVIALTLMVVATRVGRRALWMTGAGLMAVVVVKLFILDLSRISGIYRIVSFIGVGLLMLVIGYFSPVPPRRVEEKVEETA